MGSVEGASSAQTQSLFHREGRTHNLWLCSSTSGGVGEEARQGVNAEWNLMLVEKLQGLTAGEAGGK